MIIDSHVHAIEPPSAQRPHDPSGVAAHPLPAEELLRDARAAGVDKILQIVPSAMGYDNRYGFEMAERFPEVFGVVIRFDPVAADPGPRLTEFAGNEHLAAVRVTLNNPETVAVMVAGEMEPFFKAVQDHRINIQIYAPNATEETLALVRRYPGIRWLVDHMGLRYRPGLDQASIFRSWPQLLALGKEPNVWIKCSYFPEVIRDTEGYPYPAAQRYLRALCDGLGYARLVWGSNYPPVTSACTYKQAVDFIQVECSFLNPDEKAAVMGGNFLRYLGRG